MVLKEICFLVKKLIVLLFIAIILTSCVTQRKIEYLQDKEDVKTFREAEFPDYRLKSNDELFINISSLDEASANIFSNSGQTQGMGAGTIQPYGASLMSYSIDKDGFLLLPVIGKIMVKNRTLSDVSLILKDSLNNILSQPVVSVKLVNRYISILGEVNSPGHFPYSQDKLTIYDAIGLAGDITEYGNRDYVTLVRNDNGENSRINVDLTKSAMLSSEYYYMRPNDILYVKPLRNKFWGMRQFPFSILFSTLTTGLLIYEITRQ